MKNDLIISNKKQLYLHCSQDTVVGSTTILVNTEPTSKLDTNIKMPTNIWKLNTYLYSIKHKCYFK